MFIKSMAKAFFYLSGWKVTGGLPPGVKKCIMVAAPHTSNHDFGLARAACYILNINLKYLIKKELMFFPLGPFFKATGGLGIDRSKKNNLVDQLVKMLHNADELVVMISPEGTRTTTKKWRTGFYYAALGAGVPIVLSYLDYKRKMACVGLVIHPTGNYVQDMEQVKQFYKNITPKHPANYSIEIT